ncbi:hypothetical protein ACWEOG_02255 [Amycolatopsis japonica]
MLFPLSGVHDTPESRNPRVGFVVPDDGDKYNHGGFSQDSSDGGVFGDPSGAGGDGSEYDSFDWKQVKAAITGGAAYAPSGQGAERAAGVSDPASLWRAANVFQFVQGVLAMTAGSLRDQGEALAGGGSAPWKGEAASVFLRMISGFSDQVKATADVLSGGDSGTNSVPQQLLTNGNNLSQAIAKVNAIDQWYAHQAALDGVKAMGNGLIPVSKRPEIVQMLNHDMRVVLKDLASRYAITIDAIRTPPTVNGPLGSTGAGSGVDSTTKSALDDLSRQVGGQGAPTSGLETGAAGLGFPTDSVPSGGVGGDAGGQAGGLDGGIPGGPTGSNGVNPDGSGLSVPTAFDGDLGVGGEGLSTDGGSLGIDGVGGNAAAGGQALDLADTGALDSPAAAMDLGAGDPGMNAALNPGGLAGLTALGAGGLSAAQGQPGDRAQAAGGPLSAFPGDLTTGVPSEGIGSDEKDVSASGVGGPGEPASTVVDPHLLDKLATGAPVDTSTGDGVNGALGWGTDAPGDQRAAHFPGDLTTGLDNTAGATSLGDLTSPSTNLDNLTNPSTGLDVVSGDSQKIGQFPDDLTTGLNDPTSSALTDLGNLTAPSADVSTSPADGLGVSGFPGGLSTADSSVPGASFGTPGGVGAGGATSAFGATADLGAVDVGTETPVSGVGTGSQAPTSTFPDTTGNAGQGVTGAGAMGPGMPMMPGMGGGAPATAAHTGPSDASGLLERATEPWDEDADSVTSVVLGEEEAPGAASGGPGLTGLGSADATPFADTSVPVVEQAEDLRVAAASPTAVAGLSTTGRPVGDRSATSDLLASSSGTWEGDDQADAEPRPVDDHNPTTDAAGLPSSWDSEGSLFTPSGWPGEAGHQAAIVTGPSEPDLTVWRPSRAEVSEQMVAEPRFQSFSGDFAEDSDPALTTEPVDEPAETAGPPRGFADLLTNDGKSWDEQQRSAPAVLE